MLRSYVQFERKDMYADICSIREYNRLLFFIIVSFLPDNLTFTCIKILHMLLWIVFFYVI